MWVLAGCTSSTDSVGQAVSLHDNTVNYPHANNVSFSQVLHLGYTKTDAELRYGDEPLQFGKLWVPYQPTPPLVIFVHGGCWLNQYDLEYSYPLASALKQQGYAVWSIEYRRVGDTGGGWPGSLNDIVQAIEFIHTQDSYRFDWKRVTLLGHSAGGHLALLAASQLSVPVSLIIGVAPIVDITQYAAEAGSCQNSAVEFMNGTPAQQPKNYAQANPVNYPFDREVVLLTGALDNIVPLTENPLPAAQFEILQEAGHFDWVHPGTPAFNLLLQYLNYE
nr:alpha/beta hydrolase [Alteromonas sp. ASW11-130]